MDRHCNINLLEDTPVVTAAIHDGHHLSEEISQLIEMEDDEQLREEDPYTGIWACVSRNHIICNTSRFEFDLNRSPEKAIYLTPEDAWGLQVWKHQPSQELLERSRNCHVEIYRKIHAGITRLVERFGTVVILDLHTYNHRRNGPDAPPADPVLNPEINVGTGTMDREYWVSIVDRIIGDLKKVHIQGRQLDVRENIKFRGGYFPKWVNENFSDSACCISLGIKKFFMVEWTGNPDWHKANISIFETCKQEILAETQKRMEELVDTGRLPITSKNIEIITESDDINIKSLINQTSSDAGLVILGFREEQIKHSGKEIFEGYDDLGTILFVNSHNQKEIE